MSFRLHRILLYSIIHSRFCQAKNPDCRKAVAARRLRRTPRRALASRDPPLRNGKTRRAAPDADLEGAKTPHKTAAYRPNLP
jgi:hypothetical protein